MQFATLSSKHVHFLVSHVPCYSTTHEMKRKIENRHRRRRRNEYLAVTNTYSEKIGLSQKFDAKNISNGEPRMIQPRFVFHPNKKNRIFFVKTSFVECYKRKVRCIFIQSLVSFSRLFLPTEPILCA